MSYEKLGSTSYIRQKKDGRILLNVLVLPGSSKNAITGWHDNSLKIKITAKPIKGEANEECRIFLAESLNLPKSAIEIISGVSSRRKRIAIHGINKDELLTSLAKRGL